MLLQELSNGAEQWCPVKGGSCLSEVSFDRGFTVRTMGNRVLLSTVRTCYDEVRTCNDEVRTCYDEVRMCYDEVCTCYDEVRTCYDDVRTCYDDVRTCYDDIRTYIHSDHVSFVNFSRKETLLI